MSKETRSVYLSLAGLHLGVAAGRLRKLAFDPAKHPRGKTTPRSRGGSFAPKGAGLNPGPKFQRLRDEISTVLGNRRGQLEWASGPDREGYAVRWIGQQEVGDKLYNLLKKKGFKGDFSFKMTKGTISVYHDAYRDASGRNVSEVYLDDLRRVDRGPPPPPLALTYI